MAEDIAIQYIACHKYCNKYIDSLHILQYNILLVAYIAINILIAGDIAIQYIARHRCCNKYIGRRQEHQYNNNIIVRIPDYNNELLILWLYPKFVSYIPPLLGTGSWSALRAQGQRFESPRSLVSQGGSLATYLRHFFGCLAVLAWKDPSTSRCFNTTVKYSDVTTINAWTQNCVSTMDVSFVTTGL
jgi:hypothetical protein